MIPFFFSGLFLISFIFDQFTFDQMINEESHQTVMCKLNHSFQICINHGLQVMVKHVSGKVLMIMKMKFRQLPHHELGKLDCLLVHLLSEKLPSSFP